MPSEKTLKTIVIVLGVLLVGGFAVLIGIMGMRIAGGALDKKEVPEAASSKATETLPKFALPEGAVLTGISHHGAVFLVSVKTREGTPETLLFDAETGDFLGRLVPKKDHEDSPQTPQQN